MKRPLIFFCIGHPLPIYYKGTFHNESFSDDLLCQKLKQKLISQFMTPLMETLHWDSHSAASVNINMPTLISLAISNILTLMSGVRLLRQLLFFFLLCNILAAPE